MNSQQYMFLLLFGEGGLLVSGGTHNDTWFLLYPVIQKVAGYYVIPSELFERPSVSASFPVFYLSRFWSICFKLCMDIDIREEWFGIANGLNSFINNRGMALDRGLQLLTGLWPAWHVWRWRIPMLPQPLAGLTGEKLTLMYLLYQQGLKTMSCGSYSEL